MPGPNDFIRAPYGFGDGLTVGEPKVKHGDRVSSGQPMAVLIGQGGEELVVTAGASGKVVEFRARRGTRVNPGDVLFKLDTTPQRRGSTTPTADGERADAGADSGERRPALMVFAAMVLAVALVVVVAKMISGGDNGSEARTRVTSTGPDTANLASDEAVAQERLVRCGPTHPIRNWNPEIELRALNKTFPLGVATAGSFAGQRLAGMRVEMTACVLHGNHVTAEPIKTGDTVSIAWLAKRATSGSSSDSLCVQLKLVSGTRLLSPLKTASGNAPRTGIAPRTRYYNIARAWPRGAENWTGGRFRIKLGSSGRVATYFARCAPNSVYGGRNYGPELDLTG